MHTLASVLSHELALGFIYFIFQHFFLISSIWMAEPTQHSLLDVHAGFIQDFKHKIPGLSPDQNMGFQTNE